MKGMFAHQHLIQHHSECPDISPAVGSGPIAGFRAKITDGADHDAGLGEAGYITHMGDPKICQAWRAICSQKNVLRFQITEYDPFSVV